MRKILFIFFLNFIQASLISQESNRPKLVIGVVVDQMRYDYLEKFEHSYSKTGFLKLMNEGLNLKNTHYNYKPTYTAPGHATIYTGVSPSIHGIVGNYWYSKEEEKSVYCVELESDSEKLLAPTRLNVEGVADMIKRHSKGKSYGIALKDRGAILPAGHMADGAYWFNSDNGEWESSSYYRNQNPDWLSRFNSLDFYNKYLAEGWELLTQNSIYCIPQPNELLKLDSSFVFNHDITALYKSKKWGVLKSVPNGNQMTVDLAKELIIGENLGQNETTDFLSISFSATDYVGHKYGIESAEVYDTYVKLDRSLSELLTFLDEQIGKGEYLLFLSSDHGAGYSREYLKKNREASGFINTKKIKNKLDSCLDEKFGEAKWIESFTNLNFYFSKEVKNDSDLNFSEVLAFSINCLKGTEGILKVWNPNESTLANSKLIEMAKNGYSKVRSGDLILIEEYGWTTYYDKGSTHGSPYDYDTHVPLLFYGNGVMAGESNQTYSVVDIVPSVLEFLGLAPSEDGEGKLIEELF